ncbi:MAG: single-stranded DNA-binding protein [Microthrixaceae bacterium]
MASCRRRRHQATTPSPLAPDTPVPAGVTRGENDAKWLTKGRHVAIAGRLHHNTWTDNDGNNRERYEVIANQVTYLDQPRRTSDDPKPGEEAF